jgi:hypothetical protein
VGWFDKGKKMKVVTVLYFDKKSIFTVDLPVLFKTLFDAFPDSEMKFIEMNEEYKSLSSEHHEFGMVAIKKRLIIFEENNRREDLEDLVIRLGMK